MVNYSLSSPLAPQRVRFAPQNSLLESAECIHQAHQQFVFFFIAPNDEPQETWKNSSPPRTVPIKVWIFLQVTPTDSPLQNFGKPRKSLITRQNTGGITPILRQALLTTYCVAIHSVRICFMWKLTAITPLQIGHLILMIPSVFGSASKSLRFLQHGHATCISFCIIPAPFHIRDHNNMANEESFSRLVFLEETSSQLLPY